MPALHAWLPRWIVALTLVTPLVACAPAASPSPTPTTAASPAAKPAAPASPTAAAPAPSPAPAVSPSPAASPGPAAAGAARRERHAVLAEANAAFDQKDYATALRLYRQAAEDPGLQDPSTRHAVPPGPDLGAFARFRIVVVDAIVGQEDDARAVLDQMRQQDGQSPFLGLALAFWDVYGMTADPRAACGAVTRAAQEQPERFLRSLTGWGDPRLDLSAADLCRLP